MNSGEYTYIWQLDEWPNWKFSHLDSELLSKVNLERGRLLGNMQMLGLPLMSEATLEILTSEVVKTSAIEGEKLDPTSVRSSIARRLGIEITEYAGGSRNIEGIVEIVLDATKNFQSPLVHERLFGWHAALFPTGRSLHNIIDVAMYRSDGGGPMEIVSGHYGKTKVHYVAPPAAKLNDEMEHFLHWFETASGLDPIIKAGIAHLWFESLHPFDDGNGRIGRAICDMALARADGTDNRFYSLSTQIEHDRKAYYYQLESAQKGSMDISDWINWFLGCVLRAISRGHHMLENIKFKSNFWKHWAHLPLNVRQIQMLNMVIENFEGNLTSSKWAKITKCSPHTALRDISELIDNEVLVSAGAGGRSTHYLLRDFTNNLHS